MSLSALESLKIKAKLLQKAKRKSGQEIALKDAFQILAKAAGFSSWRELKDVLEETEHFSPHKCSAQWKTWYASYGEALAHLRSNGGFLLPYRKQFFICDLDYVESLGVRRNDPDLAKVGPNWVEPSDPEAWARLNRKVKEKMSKAV